MSSVCEASGEESISETQSISGSTERQQEGGAQGVTSSSAPSVSSGAESEEEDFAGAAAGAGIMGLRGLSSASKGAFGRVSGSKERERDKQSKGRALEEATKLQRLIALAQVDCTDDTVESLWSQLLPLARGRSELVKGVEDDDVFAY